MYYSDIKANDIANGEGIRTTIFVSGCRLHCKGCFNSCTWDFKYGKPFTEDQLNEIIELSNKNHIKGLTILGGEPFEPENQEQVLNIIKTFKKNYPNKTIWMFSGYTLDGQIKKWCDELPFTKEIIQNIDVLIDGPFKIDLYDIALGFRGSSNQRIIDIKKTIENAKIVLHSKHFHKENKNIWK